MFCKKETEEQPIEPLPKPEHHEEIEDLQELIIALREGEIKHRKFKNGLALAQKVSQLQSYKKELTASVESLLSSQSELVDGVQAAQVEAKAEIGEMRANAEMGAKTIVHEAEQAAEVRRANVQAEVDEALAKRIKELDERSAYVEGEAVEAKAMMVAAKAVEKKYQTLIDGISITAAQAAEQ